MDRIFLSNMAFFAHHGVAPQERRLGQRFFVDVDCFLDLRPAGEADDYGRTVCYAAVYETVRTVMTGGPANLLETLAERIAQAVLDQFPATNAVRVTIRKPSAPVEGVLDHAGVEIMRRRGDQLAGPVGFRAGSGN
ncbi:MAG: dihydroneopterin aldolase [Alphaproteobacteria bacterium]